MSNQILVDHHFLTAVRICASACEILDVLPESDLVTELQHLIYSQFEIFCNILEGKHFGTDNLNNLINYSIDVSKEVSRIKGE